MKRSLRNVAGLCATLLVCTIVVQASVIIGPLYTNGNGDFIPNPAYSPKVTSAYYGGYKIAPPWVFSGTSNSFNDSGVVGKSAVPWDYKPMNGASYNAFIQGNAYVSQTLSLTKGDFYTLTFYLAARPGYNVDPVGIFIGGTMQMTQLSPTVSVPTGIVTGGTQLGTTITLSKGAGWTKETETFTATSKSEVLTFEGMNASGTLLNITTGPPVKDWNIGLDTVTVQAPEPAMALLLPLGLLFVKGLRKRFQA